MTIYIIRNRLTGVIYRDCFRDKTTADKTTMGLNAKADPYNTHYVVDSLNLVEEKANETSIRKD